MIKKHHLALTVIAIVVLVVAVTAGLAIGHRRQSNKAPTETYTLQVNNPASTTTVELTASGPVPASVLVKQGANIRWMNKDTREHTVTSDSGIVQKITLKPNQQYTVVASNSGTFTYTVDGKASTITVN